MQNKILAFCYSVLANRRTQKLMVVAKILAPPKAPALWTGTYLQMEEIPNLTIPLRIYYAKEICLLVMSDKNKKTCEGCAGLHFQQQCLNNHCPLFCKLDFNKFEISNVQGEIRQTLNEVMQSDGHRNVPCKKCQRCRKCRPNKKCYLHKVCAHIQSARSGSHYHLLNKLALHTALLRSTQINL